MIEISKLIKTDDFTTITPEQSRAARALLDWSQHTAARFSNIGVSTLAAFERGTHMPHPNNMRAIVTAYDSADIAFVGLYGVINVKLMVP